MNWTFSDPPNEAVITSAEIVSGEMPVLLVSHYPEDDGWAFLHGGTFTMDSAKLASLKSIVDRDPTLMELSD